MVAQWVSRPYSRRLNTALLTSRLKNRFYDENSLKDVCGCLVRISYRPVMGYNQFSVTATGASYAHYTVREFLEGCCVRESPAASFGISGDSVLVESLEMALTYATKTPIQWDDSHFNAPLDAADSCTNIAILRWPVYVAVCAARSLHSLPSGFIMKSSNRLWKLYQLLVQEWFDSTERLLCMRQCNKVFFWELGNNTISTFTDIVSPTWQKTSLNTCATSISWRRKRTHPCRLVLAKHDRLPPHSRAANSIHDDIPATQLRLYET